MSGFFTLYDRNGAPVDNQLLSRLAATLSHRGPDGVTLKTEGEIGMIHCMLQTTPESLHETLPLFLPERRVAITADVRIDNREALADVLDISTSMLASLSDSSLILKAYEKWGTDCGDHLVGDFAFCIWDFRHRLLFALRDPLGIKPLFYRKEENYLALSSEIKPLVQMEQALPPVNEAMVAEYLSFNFANRGETLFQGIHRLPAAHKLIYKENSLKLERYWGLAGKKKLFYRNQEEYSHHFLELFQQSVSSKIRCHLPVSAELSGGLDSSSIVTVASTLTSDITDKVFTPHGLVFPHLPCDESSYIDSVAEKLKLNVTLIPHEDFSSPNWQQQVVESYRFPDMPNLSICDTLVAKVRESGSRVILSGIGGDEYFCGYGACLQDYISHGRWNELLRECISLVPHGRGVFKRALRQLIWPHLPFELKKNRCTRDIEQNIPPWIPKRFVMQSQLLERIIAKDPRLHGMNLADAFTHKYLLTDIQGFFLETLDIHRARRATENRYPFLDKRLIEFAYSLPDYLKIQGGLSKFILRQALKQYLPEKIFSRSDKAEFSYFFGQAFIQPEYQMSMKAPFISTMGWIDAEKFSKEYWNSIEFHRKHPKKPVGQIWPLWFAFAVELWYKTLYKQ